MVEGELCGGGERLDWLCVEDTAPFPLVCGTTCSVVFPFVLISATDLVLGVSDVDEEDVGAGSMSLAVRVPLIGLSVAFAILLIERDLRVGL